MHRRPFLALHRKPGLSRIFSLQFVILCICALLTVACGSLTQNSANSAASTNLCTECARVSISPANPSVLAGEQVQFSATVTNTSHSAVNWSASEGSITPSGLFTAPANTNVKTITVTAANVAQPTMKASTTASVTNAKLTMTTSSIPAISAGIPYNAPLTASGGIPPYSWKIISGSLPSGLQLGASSGTISGDATQSGTFSLLIAVTDSGGHEAQQNFTLSVSHSSPTCGPPNYSCSRTDDAVVPLSTVPNVGNLTGANMVVTDPEFGNSIVRVTDVDTAPNQKNVTFVAASGGSSNANTWNVDSSLIFVQDTNATGYPMTFDSSSMQAARMYVSSFPSTGGMTVAAGYFSWSRVNPNYLYVLSGTKIMFYDFTNRQVAPSAQLLYDFTSSANCLPPGFTPTWQDFGGVSEGDTAFAVGFSNTGFQGTGTYTAIYTAGKGCTLVNTRTGQITSDWGETGSMSTSDRFTLHDAFITKSGGWAILGSTNCLASTCGKGPYFWQVGTTTVTVCGPPHTTQLCGGHWTAGYSHWANNDQDPIGQYHSRLFDDLNAYAPIISVLPSGLFSPLDQHPSWNNVNPDDSLPFISSTWTTATPITTAWQNEILGVSPTTGTVWRFAHDFITAQSQRFDDKEAIGQVSQDGRFFMFSSDWMGTLGSESGSSTCTIGRNCRGDVFVVQLN